MGIWSSFVDIVDFLWRHRDNDNEHSRKRRADEICDMPDNKLRCVESLLHNGEAHSVIHDSGSRKKDRSNVFPSPQLREKVYISSWNHNGKENCHDFRSVMKNHNMDDKHSEDDIQILEEHNFRSSKKGQRSSNTPFKASCSNGLNNVAQFRSPQSSKDAEIVQILQSPRMNRNEAKVLTNRTPASRDERGNRSSHLTNKPFKATDLPSSTPVTFSSRRSIVHSPEEPEIEVLPSPSMASGVSPFPYRNQNSSVLADSINTQRSSNCSTLYHLKRVEEEEAYSRLFVQCCGVERPMKMSSPKSPEVVELDAPRRNSILKPSFRSPIKYHSSPMAEARGKRISVPVEIAKSEPSTSASRQQIEDQDLQFIGQVQRPEPVKFTTPDVLDEILKKYADKEKKMEEIRAEEKKCRLLSERNRHAEVQRRVNVEKEILEQIESFLHIVEEIPQDEAPSLPVLTEEMEAEIDKALGAHPDAVLANAFNLSIKGRDMRTLKPLAWLNDEVINFYMNLLIERGKSESYPSVHAFNTFFFPKLIGSGYDSLKRWTRKVDIFSHDFILVPIHRGMHWCMAIINMKEKVICYYDSMDGRFPQCADALLNYLQKESMDKKKQPFDTSGWIKEHAENIPQQNNGSDCGMFACMYAEYVSRNAPISFTQDDMPYFRRKVVYEILKIKLLT